MRRRLALLAVAAVLTAACNGAEVAGGSPQQAVRIAEMFLTAVEGHDTDTAWSLVYPGNRRALFDDDRAGFEALIDGIDLAGVPWQVTGAENDGDGRYRVTIRIDPDAVSPALGTFVQVVPGLGDTGVLTVDITPFGEELGVLGG